MSDLLKEKGWKAVLAEKKNLGLKVMGTGVSKKLRDCETLFGSYADELTSKGKDYEALQVYADNYLKALADLIQHLDREVGKHPLFTTAMAYLKKVVAEAKKEQVEVKTRMKLEKEEWLIKQKKGNQLEKQVGEEQKFKPPRVAPRLDALTKQFVAANLALTKAMNIGELMAENSDFQKALKTILENKETPPDLQKAVQTLQSNLKKIQGAEFARVKDATVKTLQNAIAKLPR